MRDEVWMWTESRYYMLVWVAGCLFRSSVALQLYIKLVSSQDVFQAYPRKLEQLSHVNISLFQCHPLTGRGACGRPLEDDQIPL